MLSPKTLVALTVASLICVNLANAQQKNIVETAVGAGNFTTLVTAVKAAGLAGALSGHDQLTVFAPTDEAFAKLDPELVQSLLKPENKAKLAAVLKYHVVPGRVSASAAYGLQSANSLGGQRLNLNLRGDKPTINDSTIIATDIECTNGVIHVIDTVMIPALDSIPATAVKAGSFKTLVAAVGAAGLSDVLSGPGPFTVFAPTDEAFSKLPAGTVETLLKPENKQKLVDILKYHVVSGRVYDDTAVKAARAQTLLNRSVEIKFGAGGIKINDATVVAKNVNASNGVIHVIDQVLLPSKGMSPAEAMTTLTNAINRGVPVYNAGHHGQCCDIYSAAMTKLMDTGVDGLDAHTMTLVKNSLGNAANMRSDTDRAWELRRGIDSVYNRLAQMPMQR